MSFVFLKSLMGNMPSPAKVSVIAFMLLSVMFEVDGFEFLVFAQQHPPGYCRSTFKQKCIVTKMKENFTIHGLWPSAKDENIQHCDTRKFDAKEVQPIRTRLEDAWPSFRTNDPTVFWSHEWKKHGTCGYTSPTLTGIFNYFNTTLSLHERFNLLELLKQGGITPSTRTPHKINEIRKALSKEIRGNVQLTCDNADGFAHPILTEVRFCVGEDLRIMDCPSKKERCGKDRIFFLPLKESASSGSRSAEISIGTVLLGYAISYLFVTHGMR